MLQRNKNPHSVPPDLGTPEDLERLGDMRRDTNRAMRRFMDSSWDGDEEKTNPQINVTVQIPGVQIPTPALPMPAAAPTLPSAPSAAEQPDEPAAGAENAEPPAFFKTLVRYIAGVTAVGTAAAGAWAALQWLVDALR